MTEERNTRKTELDPATRRMIEATNAEDREAFLAAFAEDAVVDDFGRRFEGKAEISAWNDQENIGTRNRIEVTGVSPDGNGIIVSVQVSGDGYNGGGTFAIRSGDGAIRSMVIRA